MKIYLKDKYKFTEYSTLGDLREATIYYLGQENLLDKETTDLLNIDGIGSAIINSNTWQDLFTAINKPF